MIAIVNKGQLSEDGKYDSGGERRYVVKVNMKVVAEFTHFRRDGLAVCLRKAAEAVEKEQK